MTDIHNIPSAMPGFRSYRYKTPRYGYVMISARTHAEALAEARRSVTAHKPELTWLDVWCETRRKYVPAMYN